MKFLTRFNCGCTGIDFGDGKQLVVEGCYGDSEEPALFLKYGALILESNLPGVPDPIATERLVREINRLVTAGRKFEKLQQILGVQ